jgi:hypothetical protein
MKNSDAGLVVAIIETIQWPRKRSSFSINRLNRSAFDFKARISEGKCTQSCRLTYATVAFKETNDLYHFFIIKFKVGLTHWDYLLKQQRANGSVYEPYKLTYQKTPQLTLLIHYF